MGAMDTAEKEPAGRPASSSRRIEISLTQLVAGSAAAVCGAWLASRVGLAGTVVGAGVVSALVTVLSAVYAHGARRASERLAQRLDAVRTRGPLPASYAADTPAVGSSFGDAGDVGLAADTDAMVHTNPLLLPPFELEDTHGYRWGRIALAALVVFVLGMGAVTVVELVAGHPLACTTGANCQGTTTVPLPGRRQSATHAPSPTPTPSASTATSAPGPSATSPAPTASPTSSGSPTPSGSGSPSPTATTSSTGTATASPSPTAGG